MSIINFNKGKKDKEKTIQNKIDNSKEEVDLFIEDLCQILENKDYSNKIKENINGMVLSLDFETNEISIELLIKTDKGENDES
jgi:hypothetical protein